MCAQPYYCEHLSEVIDEREGIIVCYDCGLVLSNYFFSQTQTFNCSQSIFQEEIKEILERLNLPQIFANDVLQKLKSCGKNNSRTKKLIPYFVYKTLNEIGCPVSIKDISSVSGISENDLYDMQESESLVLNPHTLLEKYCKLLGLNDFKIYSVIKEKMPVEDTGHNPLTIIASLIYKYCKENNLKYSMKEIASTVGISSVSIQRYIKKC
jgi:transcription initiation factor TFIIIB Brf1 subunit/transcription initiation factor TFIIB